jgi:hypothetical protein
MRRRAALGTPLVAWMAAGGTRAAGVACRADAGSTPVRVVELYTSEGCSSCPPADRWLSALKGRAGVVALAFHVDYWDGLGWPDRFASREFTARQRALAAAAGRNVVYTPQVLVDGADWRGWPALPGATPVRAPALQLERDGERVVASVGPSEAAAAGYWAWLEDGHASRVRAGENAGETLHHDHVVRRLEAVGTWPARTPRRPEWRPPPKDPKATAGRAAFVVTDAATGRPIQALTLAC